MPVVHCVRRTTVVHCVLRTTVVHCVLRTTVGHAILTRNLIKISTLLTAAPGQPTPLDRDGSRALESTGLLSHDYFRSK